jgi:hypothetical protein
MPITDILFLVGTICAFAAFAGVLAWGDYRTRSIGRPNERTFRPAELESHVSSVSAKTIGQNDRPKHGFIACSGSATDLATPRTHTHA